MKYLIGKEEYLAQYRNHFFGKFKVNRLDYVFNHSYLKDAKVEVLEVFTFNLR